MQVRGIEPPVRVKFGGLSMSLITQEVLERHYAAARRAGASESIVDAPEYRASLEAVLAENNREV